MALVMLATPAVANGGLGNISGSENSQKDLEEDSQLTTRHQV